MSAQPILRAVSAEATVEIQAAEDWERWLSEHGDDTDGVWLKLGKKGKGMPAVAYGELLDAALCHGWIDGQRRALDETRFLQRFVPRRPRSIWSKRNRENAERLIAEGRMQPRGLAEVERAKADGRWAAAYDGQSTATVPGDLQAELDRRPAAAEFFTSLDSRNRYAILHRLATAKKPETRARRLAKFVAMLEAGEKIYP
jgi:uncharacterized protein YdeI (YjbR/CyaY-like superfamily)